MRRSLTSSEERRGLTLSEARVEVRADEDGANPRFAGHAAVFNTRTAIGNPLTWGFYEEIAPGAFTKTLDEGDARMLIDHDPYYVVARASADTLELSQDKIGLRTEAALDTNLSYVNDLIANLRNGNITGMSFGFYVVKDDWDVETVETSDGQTAEVEVRTIREAKLVEVSAVTFPAYEDTDAGLRAQVVPALRRRGDVDAIARRAKFRPELTELLGDVRPTEPAETTREDANTDAPQGVDDVERAEEAPEPAETTRNRPPDARIAAARLRASRPRRAA